MAYFFLALFDGGASLSGGEMMSRNRLRMIWRKKESKKWGKYWTKGWLRQCTSNCSAEDERSRRESYVFFLFF